MATKTKITGNAYTEGDYLILKRIFAYTQQVSNTGNTTENTISVLTFVIPSGTLDVIGGLQWIIVGSKNNTNSTTYRIKLSDGTNTNTIVEVSPTTLGFKHFCSIDNRGILTAQIAGGFASGIAAGFGTTGSTAFVGTINFGVDVTCTVTMQNTVSSSDILRFESYKVFAT